MENENEDIHICGKCRLEFHNLESFLQHKGSCFKRCPTEKHDDATDESAEAVACSPAATITITSGGIEELELTVNGAEAGLAEETVETLPSSDSADGGVGKHEIFFDASPDDQGNQSTQNVVFNMPPTTGDEDKTMSVFSLDAEGNMVELPLRTEMPKPTPIEPQITESILDTNAFIPVTLGEVVATPSTHHDDSEESSGMVPDIDVPVRLGPKIFPCNYDGCSYITKYAKDLQRHLLVHTGEKPFICGECKKAFNRIDKLKIHQRIHSGFKPFRCQFCAYACSERSAMKKHMRTHSDDRPFKCMICPYASRNSSQLIVHLRTHTGDAPFQCHICASKFKVNSDLKRHMRTHTGEKPFKCPHCEYRCSVKSNLKPHVQLNHEPSELQRCLVPGCGFETNTKGDFKAHQRTHANYRQTLAPTILNCSLCNYKCSNKTNLTMHMQTDHSAEGKKTIQEVLENGPFICTFCHFTAKFQTNLRKHVRRNHPEAFASAKSGPRSKDGTNDNKKNFAAAVLAAALRIKKGSLKKKGGAVPVDKKPFQCLYCGKSFLRQEALNLHSKSHKGIILGEEVTSEATTTEPLHANHVHEDVHATESGLINVSVIGSDKVASLSSHDQGPIILQSLGANEVSLKPVQILTHNQMNNSAFTGSILHAPHPAEVQHHSQHFAPHNLMALPTPGPSGHITLQHMGQHIPTTSHHLMEPAQPNLPVVQSADGQTHYLIIQPHS